MWILELSKVPMFDYIKNKHGNKSILFTDTDSFETETENDDDDFSKKK